MINALAFWPKGRLLASASDDTTVRFWRLNDRSLIGTLAAWRAGTDWVVFTPDGLFDASPEGERSVTWRHESARGRRYGPRAAIARLEQFRDQRFVFDLAETLSRGEDPKPPARVPEAPPPQVILEPAVDSGPGTPTGRPADPSERAGITDLRLYHNGVAVFADLKPTTAPRRRPSRWSTVRTASMPWPDEREASTAARRSILLNYDGPTPGRVHVLALGVSKYQTQALRYAEKDARAIAAFLRQRGVSTRADPVNRTHRACQRRCSKERKSSGSSRS